MNMSYPSDLTDQQWKILAPLIPAAKRGGRKRTTDIRQVINGILYVLRTGCSWGFLPHEYPPHQTVYDYFAKWKKEGTWKRIHDELVKMVRKKSGKEETPSALIIDSQSVKTTEKGGFGDTMRGRKSKDENGTLLLIRLD